MSTPKPLPGRNDPCPCGSGKKFKKCCVGSYMPIAANADGGPDTAPLFSQAQALFESNKLEQAIALYKQILAIKPQHYDAMHYQGLALFYLGQHEAALALISKSIDLNPQEPMFHNNMGLVMRDMGDHKAAERYFINAVNLDSKYVDAHYNLADLMLWRQNNKAAARHLEIILQLTPGDHEVRLMLANAYRASGMWKEASELYEELINAVPDHPAVRLDYSTGLAELGETDVAVEQLEFVLQLHPDLLLAVAALAKLYERVNRLDDARAMAQKVLDSEPDDPGALLVMAKVAKRQKHLETALEWLDRLKPQADELARAAANNEPGSVHTPFHVPAFYYERGTVLDKLKHYDEAFEAFAQANQSVVDIFDRHYGKDYMDSLWQKQKAFFVRETMSKLPRAGVTHDRPQPLFVVGFMRSGTTLTEQILAAHPNIVAGDELKYIPELSTALHQRLQCEEKYPEALLNATVQDLESMRDYYLDRVDKLGFIEPGINWFTDKMPLNENRLGLINLIFPDSPVIHVIRHPLDVCLSTFFNEMTHGVNCSLKLETAAYQYANTMEMVDHYRQHLDIRYHAVRYEDVVNDPENQARALIHATGEEWDDRCLEFYKAKRVARTASYAQVTEKIYSSSKFRYKHYMKQVEPIIPILEPVIRKLGYEI